MELRGNDQGWVHRLRKCYKLVKQLAEAPSNHLRGESIPAINAKKSCPAMDSQGCHHPLTLLFRNRKVYNKKLKPFDVKI